MSTPEFTWTPEMLARRSRIGIITIVIGLSILALVVYKIKVYQWRNEMLLSAALDNNPKRIQELLANGTNCRATDVYGNSILSRAKHSGDAVNLLLEKCTDISAEEKTAVLVRAAYMNYVGTVKVLLDKAANINDLSRSRWNALMIAASKGHFGVASLLVERGADINAKDHEGKNALMLACEDRGYALAPGYRHLEIIQLLLEKGADVNARDFEGKTALGLALARSSWERHYLETIELLKAHGAKE